ncbi:PBECR4 domain-containing protein [uncultured Fusobacterium sp.]|uniref:PBECR4 domain-containing protein n=1 Tax=uncultured Fusobacterium sp. TaxID=159267 RepID=UPI0025FDEA7F|nr:PBECR4 domain-containing protein [uncultured Fusobacterium sp.]
MNKSVKEQEGIVPTQEQLDDIKKALKIYEEKLLNKEILILHAEMSDKNLKKLSLENLKTLKKINGIEIAFEKKNFMHLAGIIRKSIKIPLNTFYDNMKANKIFLNDFKVSEFTEKKSLIFPQLPLTLRSIGTVGDYNYSKINIEADKIIGSTRKTNTAVLGVREKQENIVSNFFKKMYAPVTLLDEITENLIKSNTQRKILAIFEKSINDKFYTNLVYKHKEYPIENIYNNKEIYKLLTFDLQEKILLEISDREKKELKPKENTEEKVKAVEKIKSKKEKPRREKRSRIRSKTKER